MGAVTLTVVNGSAEVWDVFVLPSPTPLPTNDQLEAALAVQRGIAPAGTATLNVPPPTSTDGTPATTAYLIAARSLDPEAITQGETPDHEVALGVAIPLDPQTPVTATFSAAHSWTVVPPVPATPTASTASTANASS